MQKFKNEFKESVPDLDFYIIKQDEQKQERLLKIRAIMRDTYPDLAERIYYGIPTVDLHGKIILQYAAYKNHISLLICKELSALLKEKYPQYNYTDYTVFFLDKEPFPEDFVKEVCKALC